jgi:hypothetical protein
VDSRPVGPTDPPGQDVLKGPSMVINLVRGHHDEVQRLAEHVLGIARDCDARGPLAREHAVRQCDNPSR